MDLIFSLATVAVALGLLTSSCLYLVDPSRARTLLKRLAVGIVVLFMGGVIAGPIVETMRTNPLLTVFILIPASLAAYAVVRSQRDRSLSGHRRDGRERTPLIFRPRDEDF